MPASVTTDSRRAPNVTFRVAILLSIVLFAVFVIPFFVRDGGIAELQHARQRVADLQSDITRLEAENARLRSEIDSVKKSTFAVERIAREDLGMAKKGEVVYMLPRERPATDQSRIR